MNWRRGLTRLYAVAWVLWGVWLLLLGMEELLQGPKNPDFWLSVGAIIFFGLVAPAVLLWAFRWVVAGFKGK